MPTNARNRDQSSRNENTRNLSALLRRHLGQRTVLGVAIPVLEDYIEATQAGKAAEGLTEKQIEEGFRKLATQFLHSDYHSTYIARRMGKAGFLDFINGRYRLRASMVDKTTTEDLIQLRNELLESLRSAFEQRQTAIRRLEDTCSLPADRVGERLALVEEYLSHLSGNRGEIFEVVSFAVLREYFRTFGFSLQRFSTTHANDGGMDFFAADAIYQVTTDESIEKLRRDLRKAPGTKRVLVRPTVTEEILALGEDKVLETIELSDLLSHFIKWLLGRDKRSKQSNHLQRVLQVALEEFRREDKAEIADRQVELIAG
jgi:hypothetical protein